MKTKIMYWLAMLLIMAVAIPVAAQEDECTPTVTLTVAGITLEGCEGNTLIEIAQEIQEDASPAAKDLEVDEWEITWFAGATNQMQGRGRNPWPEFENVAPTLWPEFPNTDNPAANFEASDGLEYDMAESDYFQNDLGDILVPPNHFRLITGDYNVTFDECEADEEFTGCALMLVNVGEVTSNFEDAMVNNGFSVFGRYWNGDTLPIAINALMSHTAYNMLGLAEGTNAGGNCSNVEGCARVRLTVVILSGNEVLGIARTYVETEEAEG